MSEKNLNFRGFNGIAKYVLRLLGSTAPVERIFSAINSRGIWSDEKFHIMSKQ